MPSWKRLNDSLGTWVNIKNMYRMNDTAGNWVRIKKAFRLNDAYGTWVKVFDALSDTPVNTVAPVLQTGSGSTTTFTQIDTITLDRGTWDNMTSEFDPTSYSLQIQKSTTGNSGWTDAATGTGSTISYPITLNDVTDPSYYFRGRVTATNVNGSSTVNTTPVRSNMLVTISLNGAPVVSDTDIFVAWTIVRPTNGTYLSSQKVEVFNSSNNALLYTAGVALSSASIYSHSIPTSSLPSSTLVYVKVTAVGNDSALTQDIAISPSFLTPLSGTASISPSSSNRVEAGTSVSAVLSLWPSGTTFTYEWKWQQASGTITTISTTDSANVPSASGTQITLSVTGSYGGQTKTVTTANHRIHPQAPSYTINGGGQITISSVSAIGGTHYYGSFTGPASGSITERTLATNTTIQNQPSGSYTVTLNSRAYLNSIAYDSYNSNSQNATITVPVNPSSLTATTNDRTKIRLSWSGGTATDYIIASTGFNNVYPGDLNTTSFSFSSASSPYDVTTMTRGEYLFFFIRSRVLNGDGTYSYASTWFPSTTPGVYGYAPLYAPGTPTGLTGTTISSSRIDISWTAPTTNSTQDAASGYDIYYSTSSSAPNAFTTPTTTSTTTSKSITSLSSNTTYYFWVRATNVDNTGSNASAWSSVLSRTTQATLSDPSITFGPKQIGARSTSAVSWSATISSPATSWVVDYGTTTSYGSTISALSSGATATTGDYAIGTTVYYRIRAFNSSNSTYSNGITGSYTTVRKVTGVTASTSSTAPFVIWTVQAHGMASMSTYVYKSTTVGGNTFATGASDPILSGNTATGQQTRQTSVTPGGTGYKYYLQFLGCYSGNNGTGSVFESFLTTSTFTHPGSGTITVYTT